METGISYPKEYHEPSRSLGGCISAPGSHCPQVSNFLSQREQESFFPCHGKCYTAIKSCEVLGFPSRRQKRSVALLVSQTGAIIKPSSPGPATTCSSTPTARASSWAHLGQEMLSCSQQQLAGLSDTSSTLGQALLAHLLLSG